MPWWIGDYMRDTMDFSAVEHGAYLMLLAHYWQHGSIPRDNKKLKKIARLSGRGSVSVLNSVISKFTVGTTNYVHKRADFELAKARGKKAKSSEKAKKAADARWKDRSKGDACSTPQAMLEQCPPSPSPSPSPYVSTTKLNDKEGGMGGTKTSMSPNLLSRFGGTVVFLEWMSEELNL